MSENLENVADQIHILDDEPLEDRILISELVSDNSPEHHQNSEGIKPREFVANLEALSMIKVQAEAEFLQLYEDVGRFKFLDDSCVASLKSSPQRLQYSEQVMLAGLGKRLEEAHAPEIASEALSNLTEAVNAKRRFLNAYEGRFRLMSDDDIPRKNNKVSQAMFRKLFPDKDLPDDLHYIETPLSVVFLVKDIEEVTKLHAALGGDRNKPVGGFATTRKFEFNDDAGSSELPVHFQVMQSRNPTEVTLDAGIFRHELQHSIDQTAMSKFDTPRAQHLNRSRQNRTEAPSMYATSKHRLKSEISAFHESDPTDPLSIKEHLTNPKGHYNYEGILDKTGLESVVEATIGKNRVSRSLLTAMSPTERFEYQDLVTKGVDSLTHLRDFYKDRFGDEKFALRFSIAMLDSFPVQDWAKMEKIIKKYS